MTSSEVLIRIQATPNPNAWKFVLDRPILTDGKASYSTPEEAAGNRMATDLLHVEGVKQVHFFANVITISHRFDVDAEKLKADICAIIQTRMPIHDPNLGPKDLAKEKRASLPIDLQAIEGILDRTVRPGLQGDGGDIEVIKLEGKTLFVNYQGACGTCPSSTTGTLSAIEGILREEYDPEIEVVPLNP